MTRPPPFHIWEGAHRSFAEARASGAAFSGGRWVERSTAKARGIVEATRRQGGLPLARDYCVLPLAAALQARQPGRARLRVLEWGGSVGFLFPSLAGCLARPDDLELHVVDNAAIGAAGREVFAGDPRIHFHEAVPPGVAFDLVHLGSSLQYVEDWSGHLAGLVATGPEYLVLDDVPAGDLPTFVARQAYYGDTIAHWFWNLDGFVSGVRAATGYELFYRARYQGAFLGVEGPLPMDNYPLELRLSHAVNLAFARPAAR